jgi:hypothetical protein
MIALSLKIDAFFSSFSTLSIIYLGDPNPPYKDTGAEGAPIMAKFILIAIKMDFDGSLSKFIDNERWKKELTIWRSQDPN